MTASFLEFSEYSGWSQQCCSLDGLAFPLISNCSNSLSNPSGTVSITIGITVILMFHWVFLVLWQDLSIYLSFFYFLSGVRRNGKIHEVTSCLCFISKFRRILCVSFSWTGTCLSIFHLVLLSKINLLQSITFLSFCNAKSCTLFVPVCWIHL